MAAPKTKSPVRKRLTGNLKTQERAGRTGQPGKATVKPCIYALTDPTGDIRYIGQTNSFEKRIGQHGRWSGCKGFTHRAKWLKSLRDKGEQPGGFVVEYTDDLDAREIYWVAYYRDQGCRLVNGSDGGKDVRHMHKARANGLWPGSHTPLQSIQVQIAQTIHYLKKRGDEAAAKRVEASLNSARELLAKVRREEGPSGIMRINLRLTEQQALTRASCQR